MFGPKTAHHSTYCQISSIPQVFWSLLPMIEIELIFLTKTFFLYENYGKDSSDEILTTCSPIDPLTRKLHCNSDTDPACNWMLEHRRKLKTSLCLSKSPLDTVE